MLILSVCIPEENREVIKIKEHLRIRQAGENPEVISVIKGCSGFKSWSGKNCII